MDPPIFIHGLFLLLVTTQYPPRNNEVTCHLTWIQPLEVWALNYALQCKNPQKLLFLENMNMDCQQILFQQKPLCQSIKILWKKQGVTMCFKKLFNFSFKTLKNVFLYGNSASNYYYYYAGSFELVEWSEKLTSGDSVQLGAIRPWFQIQLLTIAQCGP